MQDASNMARNHALLRVHAGCCNSHELDALEGHYQAGSRCIRDGRLVGEGPAGARAVLEEEFRLRDAEPAAFGRVMVADHGPVLVKWADFEGRREAQAVVRLEEAEGRVRELRVDHDAALIARLLKGSRPL